MGMYADYDKDNLFYTSCGFKEFEVIPESTFKLNLLRLLKEKAITLEDLSDFSTELQEEVRKIWER